MFPSNDELFNLMLLRAASGKPPVEATATGNPLTFVTDLARPLKSLLIPFTPVQSGTGDPSPQNIRPFLPWNGLTVFGGGKNLFDEQTYIFAKNRWISAGTGEDDYNTAYACTLVFVPCEAYAGMRVTLNKRPGGYNPGIAFYTSNVASSFISGVRNNDVQAGNPITFTIPSNAKYMRFTIPNNTTEIQIEAGETATAYEPYRPITDTDIVFPSPVYGGTPDIISGRMLAKWAKIVLNGTEANWSNYNQGTAFSVPIIGMTTDNYKTVFCDRFAQIKNITSFGVYASASNDYAYFINATDIEGVTDLASWKAYLAENPMEFAYELATPQEITLTPEQITALVGDNTIWSDADGQMTAVYLKKK